jgi:hypothetical protein
MMGNLRKFGPKADDHPSIGKECPACRVTFKAGDFTTLVSLGPGDNPEQQELCREGRVYVAAVQEVHYACATGITD